MPIDAAHAQAAAPVAVQPVWVRVTHWINVLAFGVMLTSGWRIYDASPLFDFRFPKDITLGGWLGGALLWHFAAMWLFVLNGMLYLACNVGSGRAWRRLLPVAPRELREDFAAALRGRLAHDDLSRYNAVQKLAYLGAIALMVVAVLSGLVVWKSVQFPLLRTLIGGYENARIVHFGAMAGLVFFALVHVAMVIVVPRTLLVMIRGR